MFVSTKSEKIRLHLVHGTWAKGLWGTAPAWCEPGESAYQNLLSKLPANTQLESFNWSGRNSISARAKAAEELQAHLRRSLCEHPKDCHIVVAHSHGGTVANEAVRGSDIDGAVRGLICLATPFAYLAQPTLGRLQTGVLALTSLGYAAYWSALLAFMPWIPLFLGTLTFGALIAVKSLIAFFLVFILAKSSFEARTTTSRPNGPNLTPIFLLRGSRDEASLLLAEAQLFDTFCAAVASAHDVAQSTIRRPLTFVCYGLAYLLFSSIGLYVANHLSPLLFPLIEADVRWIMGIFVYAPAVAGMVYFFGYAMVAMGAGHWNVRHWLSSVVEVEAAPPNTACEMYVFSELDTPGLRHGLYDDIQVLEHVARIVQLISKSASRKTATRA
jgi:hypothetical protein